MELPSYWTYICTKSFRECFIRLAIAVLLLLTGLGALSWRTCVHWVLYDMRWQDATAATEILQMYSQAIERSKA